MADKNAPNLQIANADSRNAGTPQAQPSQQPQQGRHDITIRIDEAEMHSGYANTFRADGTPEEVILDFGMNRATPGKPNELVFKVRNQIILNWKGTKRLALTLANLVRQHEEKYGEIDINANPNPNPNQTRT